jgi:glycosyltransferase involved in cell wall biosynthesis
MESIRIALVRDRPDGVSETFIRAHAERLPGVVAVLHAHKGLPAVDGRPAVVQGWWARARRRLSTGLGRQESRARGDRAWAMAIGGARADVTLAEYGTTGALIDGACRRIGAPLVVHFHGFDASVTDVLERKAGDYRRMFGVAAAVIAVSRAMERRLLGLGCPRETLICSPYGVDCARFYGANPAGAGPVFVAVGRMVEKKGPHLLLAAFARVVAECPAARLHWIGDGALLGVCRDLAAALGIEHAVMFLGAQPHDIVEREMRQARALVQHSVTASNGDSEGTPVSILEAGAMGLPVVATRHAGIPDVVVDGVTGFLVDERDARGMATHMLTLARQPSLAGQLGEDAAVRVRSYYRMEQSLGRLTRVLYAAAARQPMDAVRSSIEGELPSTPSAATAGHHDFATRDHATHEALTN